MHVDNLNKANYILYYFVDFLFQSITKNANPFVLTIKQVVHITYFSLGSIPACDFTECEWGKQAASSVCDSTKHNGLVTSLR